MGFFLESFVLHLLRIKRAEAVAATRGLLLSFFLFCLPRNQKSINLGSSSSNTNNRKDFFLLSFAPP
jgi:hypothetical protein